MTRMWCVDPEVLCRQHLLGEHNELHKLVGSIRAGHSIEGYIDRDQVDTGQIQSRHDELVEEMERRGYNHASPLSYTDELEAGSVDIEGNLADLANRCEACQCRIEDRSSG